MLSLFNLEIETSALSSAYFPVKTKKPPANRSAGGFL
jgi:hypothetical protein